MALFDRNLNIYFLYFIILLTYFYRYIKTEPEYGKSELDDLGPSIALSGLFDIKAYPLSFAEEPEINDSHIRSLLRKDYHTYDKVSLSKRHNLVIYTKYYLYHLYAKPINDKKNNFLFIKNETFLNITNVKEFTVDWWNENIFVIRNKTKNIFAYSLRNTNKYHIIETESPNISGLIVGIATYSYVHFCAWIEDNVTIRATNDYGNTTWMIGETLGVQAIAFEPDNERFYIFTGNNTHITVFSESYSPSGKLTWEREIAIPDNEYIYRALAYHFSDHYKTMLILLYGIYDPKFVGLKIRFEMLKPEDEELDSRTNFSTRYWSLDMVWDRDGSGKCRSHKCEGIAYSLPYETCGCLCHLNTDPCDRFEYPPEKHTAKREVNLTEPRDHQAEISPEVLEKFKKQVDTQFLIEQIALFTIPLIVCICGISLFYYIKNINERITKTTREDTKDSSSSSEEKDSKDDTEENRIKNERINHLIHFFNSVSTKKRISRTKYNLIEPEEPNENYLNTDWMPEKSRRLKYKRSRRSRGGSQTNRIKLELREFDKPMKSIKSDRTKNSKSKSKSKTKSKSKSKRITKSKKIQSSKKSESKSKSKKSKLDKSKSNKSKIKKMKSKSKSRSKSKKATESTDKSDKFENKSKSPTDKEDNDKGLELHPKDDKLLSGLTIQKTDNIPSIVRDIKKSPFSDITSRITVVKSKIVDVKSDDKSSPTKTTILAKKSFIVVDGALQLSLLQKKRKSQPDKDSKIESKITSDKISNQSSTKSLF